MFGKKKEDKKIDVVKVNEVLTLSKKILKIMYILLILAVVFTVTVIFKEWKIMKFILLILKIVSPLFIGIIVAWLFDPFVTFLNKKGMRRIFGTIITYLLIIGFLAIIIGPLVPLLTEQINDFAKMVPSLIDNSKNLITNILNKFSGIEGINIKDIQNSIFGNIENFGNNLSKELPTLMLNFGKSFFSLIGTFLLGLLIGFYLLVSFDNANDLIITLLPKKIHKDTKDLAMLINTSLRNFVQGSVINSLLIFVVSSIAFSFIGLKSPLLFGIFCGLTNVIPYAGPYIGGIPAVLVGFSQAPIVGIGVLIAVFIIQILEGNLIQPVIMSKTTHLHPVTIIIGLLIFGYFFGIIGMIVSTPIIASLKAIVIFFDKKYDFLSFVD